MDIYLKSFGARLRSKDGLFEITVPDISGAGKHLVAQHPVHEVESIMLQPGASVSTDALLLAFEGDVNVLILDKFGNPSGRILPNRPSSTLLIWKNQLAVSLQKEGLELAKSWIETKINERISFLLKLCAYRSDTQIELIQRNCTAMEVLLTRLRQLPITAHTPEIAAAVRGCEGFNPHHTGEWLKSFRAPSGIVPRQPWFQSSLYRRIAEKQGCDSTVVITWMLFQSSSSGEGLKSRPARSGVAGSRSGFNPHHTGEWLKRTTP